MQPMSTVLINRGHTPRDAVLAHLLIPLLRVHVLAVLHKVRKFEKVVAMKMLVEVSQQCIGLGEFESSRRIRLTFFDSCLILICG